MRFLPALLILFVITACTQNPIGNEETFTATPDIPIVETVEITPSPTQVPLQETVLMNPRPISQCPDAPDIRLIIQGRGRVTDNNDTLNLRSGPDVSFDILTALNPLDEFTVIDGPTCAGGFSWFRIRFNTTIGWIAEGDSEDYYVEPHLSG